MRPQCRSNSARGVNAAEKASTQRIDSSLGGAPGRLGGPPAVSHRSAVRLA
jgi:hypothetical protein